MDLSGDPIQEWLHRRIPEKLWHYTSVHGFQGIISSGNIFATDVRFLNDTEEFVHARKVAEDLIEKTPEFGQWRFPLLDCLKWAVSTIFGSDFLNPNSAQIFVASFTDSEDDLSQWRAYSHGSCGVSIAFDLGKFRPPIESDSAVSFAPCVYDDDKKRSLIQSAFQHFIRVAQTWWTDVAERFVAQHRAERTKPDFNQLVEFTSAVFGSPEYKAQLMKGFIETKGRVFRLAGLLKHRSFQQEREWRLVLPISPNKDKTNLTHPICFRSAGASLIPYIEFPLGMVAKLKGTENVSTPFSPVSDVLLGPGTSEDAKSAALAFLTSKSINVIPRRSDIPYRHV
jgi:hypothetical protein